MEFVRDHDTLEPADSETKAIAEFCHKRGVIVITAGTYGNVLRILVPLIATEDQLDEGFKVIDAAISMIESTSTQATLRS